MITDIEAGPLEDDHVVENQAVYTGPGWRE